MRLSLILTAVFLCGGEILSAGVPIWSRHEIEFTGTEQYDNPLYDLSTFTVRFSSPSGRTKTVQGFWDGGTMWKVRFCPDELGGWSYESECSDEKNSGLYQVRGVFECVSNDRSDDIYTKGTLVRPKGEYHITHSDGTPFFWTACTAWNGALRSTEEEWDHYLTHRARHGYNVIQFVTTQWRGIEANSQGMKAFEGSGRVEINVDFFKLLDHKVDQINDHGLIAAPVLLWALPVGAGRHLSPGYYLPENEAILLARYIVARYSGHHVVWILGGDGRYTREYEQRWKNIGRGVFSEDHHGLVSQHPHGRLWIGREYADEDWLDIVGYQSSHSNTRGTVDWINKGPMAAQWDKLPPRPIINMEPNYEEIHFRISDRDVRNASYWSLFATPIAGITYGHNGIWPWLREGESILNHRHESGTSSWRKAIDFPGSIQVGYLAEFMRTLPWWRLKPAQDILASQPGDSLFNHFIAISKTDNCHIIVAYLPVQSEIRIVNPLDIRYAAQWFDPVSNSYSKARLNYSNGVISAKSPVDSDLVLLLKKSE